MFCPHVRIFSCLKHSRRKYKTFSDPSPLTVSFKLPVSEISEIDDHKSVKRNIAVSPSDLDVSQIVTIRLSYKLKWQESRMSINTSADWESGEINISPENIKYLWIPDIIIHDLVKFSKPGDAAETLDRS